MADKTPTVAELKAELDALGIAYPSGAKKADLEALLAANEDTSGAKPETPEDEDTSGAKPETLEDEVVENVVNDHPDPAEHVICPACGNTFRPETAETTIS